MQSLTLGAMGQAGRINYVGDRAALVSAFGTLGAALSRLRAKKITEAYYPGLFLARQVAGRMRDSLRYERAGKRYDPDDRRTWHLKGYGSGGMRWTDGADHAADLDGFVAAADAMLASRPTPSNLPARLDQLTDGRGIKFILDNLGATGTGPVLARRIAPKVLAAAAKAEEGAEIVAAAATAARSVLAILRDKPPVVVRHPSVLPPPVYAPPRRTRRGTPYYGQAWRDGYRPSPPPFRPTQRVVIPWGP